MEVFKAGGHMRDKAPKASPSRPAPPCSATTRHALPPGGPDRTGPGWAGPGRAVRQWDMWGETWPVISERRRRRSHGGRSLRHSLLIKRSGAGARGLGNWAEHTHMCVCMRGQGGPSEREGSRRDTHRPPRPARLGPGLWLRDPILWVHLVHWKARWTQPDAATSRARWQRCEERWKHEGGEIELEWNG